MALVACASNVLLAAGMAIIESYLCGQLKDEQTAQGVNCYRCVMSVPWLFPMIILGEPLPTAQALAGQSTILLVLTTIFACGIGQAAFTLTSWGARPTTILTTNMVYKLLTTIVGSLVFPTDVTPLAWIGYTVSVAGFFVFYYPKFRDLRKDKKS
mmetsp:Transcript_74885/g.171633  ORF Transcript_74885/g.171633 Transcript_74885/m.171633 type:complete len:155 (-) Transcript_74885:51-515(-)